MAMQAGKLDKRIQIQRATETQDSYGEEVKTWPGTVIATLWAEKKDLDGSEPFQAQQVGAFVTTQFTVRYLSGIAAEMRVVHDGTPYDIKAVLESDRRKESLRLLCNRSAN